MTVWFVIPANRETAFRAAYLAERVHGADNPPERDEQGNVVDRPERAEAIGKMVPNADGTKLMTASARIDAERTTALGAGCAPWLEVHTSWPQPGWERG